MNVVNENKIADLVSRTIDPNARPVIIPIIATSELNSNIWKEMAKCLQNSTARFLIDDTEYRAILEEDENYFEMTSEEKTIKMLPYVQTILLINEAINLDTTYLNGNIKLTEHGNGFKDRIVACSYGNYIVSKLENKLNKENQEEDMDISNWNIIF